MDDRDIEITTTIYETDFLFLIRMRVFLQNIRYFLGFLLFSGLV